MIINQLDKTQKRKTGAVWRSGTGVPPVDHAQDARATSSDSERIGPVHVYYNCLINLTLPDGPRAARMSRFGHVLAGTCIAVRTFAITIKYFDPALTK